MKPSVPSDDGIHISKGSQTICSRCHGRGAIYPTSLFGVETRLSTIRCPSCGGTGLKREPPK
jgi:DnaJ-class molecular chaperone